MPQRQKRADKAKPSFKSELLQRMQNPLQARLILTGIMLVGGYAGIYIPFSEAIATEKRVLKDEQDRRKLSYELEILQVHYSKYQDRLTADADTNEWVQYVLGGIRQYPLSLESLDPGKTRRIGPFQAVELKIKVVGRFQDLHGFLRWLESNERLIRVDSLMATPSRTDEKQLLMTLTVLGMTH